MWFWKMNTNNHLVHGKGLVGNKTTAKGKTTHALKTISNCLIAVLTQNLARRMYSKTGLIACTIPRFHTTEIKPRNCFSSASILDLKEY